MHACRSTLEDPTGAGANEPGAAAPVDAKKKKKKRDRAAPTGLGAVLEDGDADAPDAGPAEADEASEAPSTTDRMSTALSGRSKRSLSDRPDLWDRYTDARKAQSERNEKQQRDIARAYGFPSVDVLEKWEKSAQALFGKNLGARSTVAGLVVDDGRARISSDYGARTDPFHGGLATHSGVDIAAPHGSPILAAAGGRVTIAELSGGYGYMVELEHDDGTRTRYAHASALLVERGQIVKPGQVIAKVGSTGRSTGPHVHFEVRRGGLPVDPGTMLSTLPRPAPEEPVNTGDGSYNGPIIGPNAT